MKKIKTIKQLKDEKKQLIQRRKELEKIIGYDWLELKKSVRPDKLFSKKNTAAEQTNGNTVIGDALSQLAGTITGKLVEKAGAKIHKWFKK